MISTNCPKNLLLCGPIGCGKSTMLKTALGGAAARAGGFVTLRKTCGDRLLGFALAPAAALTDSAADGPLFLDFSRKPPQNNAVFAGPGTALLQQARRYPFAVADEFGGLELLVPEFRDALWALLQSGVPCIGVFKTPEAVEKLQARIPLDSRYPAEEQRLRRFLTDDPNTRLLFTTGWQDQNAMDVLHQWVQTYAKAEHL